MSLENVREYDSEMQRQHIDVPVVYDYEGLNKETESNKLNESDIQVNDNENENGFRNEINNDSEVNAEINNDKELNFENKEGLN